MNTDRVVAAEIGRPRGLRGELIVRSQTDVPGRLEGLKDAWLQLPDGSVEPVEVVRSWRHQENWVVLFAGVDSVEAADRLRGADLWVPLEQRALLPEGEFFRS